LTIESQPTAKVEILQGLLCAGETSSFTGPPFGGKSLLLTDIGLHIAAGKDWHGRKVKQGLVAFVATRRMDTTKRRVAAWAKHHGVKDIPFVMIEPLADDGSVDAYRVTSQIDNLETDGNKCVLIILDIEPLHQKFMQHRIMERTRLGGIHVAVINLSDYRGKNLIDLSSIVDSSFALTSQGKGEQKIFDLACTGANDGSDAPVTSFRLESVELGANNFGTVTTAPVVVQL
jgi:hypothetical protein